MTLAESALFLALITGGSSVLINFLGQDLRRCQLATDFFNDEKDPSLYTPEEWSTIKSAYIEILQSACLQQEGS